MTRLCEQALFTDDVDGMTSFYRAVLGCEPVAAWPGGAQFDAEGVAILIHEALPSGEGQPPNESHVAFEVPDVDRAAAELQDGGLTILAGPADYDWGRSAYLRDPDGHLVELAQADPG